MSQPPDPMLTQAIAHLQALLEEMRGLQELTDPVLHYSQVQCWADKVGTAIADLQEVGAAVPVTQRGLSE